MHVWEVTLQLKDADGAVTTVVREWGAAWSPEKVSLEDVGRSCAAEVAVFEKTTCRSVAVRLLEPIELPA